MNNAYKLPSIVLTLLFLCAILAFWLFRLDESPGLHGDEAWFGLRASSYLQKGVDSPVGMTFYTGILQSLLSSLTFKYFGIGVWQLRLPGVLLNFLSLALTALLFLRSRKYKMLVIFLLLIMQSTMVLLYPKIAWEVTSLSYLFLLLQLSLFYQIIIRNSTRILPVFAFLMINLAGTYNHIIFSALPIALFTGSVIWIYLNKKTDKYFILILLGVNLFNIIIQILFTRFMITDFWQLYGAWIFLIVALLVGLESFFLKQIISYTNPVLDWLFKIKVNPIVFKIILCLSVITFCIFHGKSLSQALSNTALIATLFAYEFPEWVYLLATWCGYFLAGSFLYLLIRNIITDKRNLTSMIIACYLGSFCLFTTATSIRYYLIPSILIYLFLSFELNKKSLRQFIPAGIIVSAFTLLIISFTQISKAYSSDREVRAMEIPMGNKTVETSAHFLSLHRLMHFIRLHKISLVKCNTSDRYFIQNPIQFYKLAENWRNKGNKSVFVEYNYDTYGNGFRIKFDSYAGKKHSKK